MQFKLKLVAASLASLVALAAPSMANATALAQSQLNITGFTILDGAGNPIDPGAIQAQAQSSGQIAGTLSGAAPFAQPSGAINFSLSDSTGPNAATYNPAVQLAAPNGQYSGSTSIVAGNALVGGANVTLDNTVSLLDPALGTAQSNASLNATFTLTVTSPTQFQFLFDADPYLIAQLGQPGVLARAGYNMSIVVTPDAGGQPVINWTPDGDDGNAVGGTDNDAYSLNNLVQTLDTGTSLLDEGPGSFSFISNVILPGTYTLQVLGQSAVSAEFAVPEPASAALLGIALLGLGFSRRQRKASN